ncbi:MAG: sulfotransferase [Gemmatimonadales bacterium]
MTTLGRLKIVFIGGSSRAGSTLLERMLGEVPGFVSAGEVHYIWQRGFGENRPCGCGQPFRTCEFWRQVANEAFGSTVSAQAARAYDLFRFLDRPRYLPQIAIGLRTSAFRARLLEYQTILDQLYRSIGTVSGAEFLIDSSKEPATAYLLSTMPQVDLHLVHLVRDSRAVAFSWQRTRKRNPHSEGGSDGSDMPIHGPARSAGMWAYRNLAFGLMNATGGRLRGLTGMANPPRYFRVRYEDLIADPRATLTAILDSWGIRHPRLDFIVRDRTVRLGPNHILSGNPMRFTTGDVALRLDQEWRETMRPRHERLVRLITLPWLWRYGYLRDHSG